MTVGDVQQVRDQIHKKQHLQKLSNYIIARVSLSSEVDDDFEYLIKIKFKYKLFSSLIVRELRRRKSTQSACNPILTRYLAVHTQS